MADYLTHDDSWFLIDGPGDAEAFKIVQHNQRAIWDQCTPWMAYGFDTRYTSDGFASPYWTCIWARPYWLTPGLDSIKVRVKGDIDTHPDVSSNQSVEVAATHGLTSASPIGWGNEVTWTGGQKQTITISKNLDVSQPELTVLQLWVKSTVHHDSGVIPPGTTLPSMKWDSPDVLTDPDNLQGDASYPSAPPQQYAYVLSDSNDAIYFQSRVVTGGNGYFRLSKPAYDFGQDFARYEVVPMTAFVPDWLVIDEVRESSDPPSKFYTVADHAIAPGRPPEAQIGNALHSGATALTKRRRPRRCHFPVSGGTGGGYIFAKATGKRGGTAATNTPYEALVPIAPYVGHNNLRVILLVTATDSEQVSQGRQPDNPPMPDVDFEAEIMQYEAGNPASLSPAVIDQKTLVPAQNGRLKVPMDETFIDHLLAGQRYSIVELNLTDIPDQAQHSGDDNLIPWALRLRMDVNGTEGNQIVRVYAVPFIYSEA